MAAQLPAELVGVWSERSSCDMTSAELTYTPTSIAAGEAGHGAFRAEISAVGDPRRRTEIRVTKLLFTDGAGGPAPAVGDTLAVRREGDVIRELAEWHDGHALDYGSTGPVWYLCKR